jgi:dTDP-N-acetylfucosamine:lipid II N-acetylfucosaminyltransferase
MILHIIPDSVFTDFVINKFHQIAPNNNDFFLEVEDVNNINIKYTKTKNFKIVDSRQFIKKDFIDNLHKYDAIVVHGLFSTSLIRMILKSSKKTRIVWLAWGGDFYDKISELRKNLYLNKTSKLLYEDQFTNIKSILRFFLRPFLNKFNDFLVRKVYDKVDFFGPVLFSEYLLVDKILNPLHCQYIPFSYGQLEGDLLKGIEDKVTTGENILLGNSASYSNNHVEAIELLSKLNLKGRKVITPLSYGDDNYRNKIISVGNEKLGFVFYPVVEFIKKNEYNKLLSSCSVAIMNHKRQQSMGNIISLMYLGCKLFFNPENPVYYFFKKEGAIVFSTNDLFNDANAPFDRLTDIEVKKNRTVLMEHWSDNAVTLKYLHFLELLKKY